MTVTKYIETVKHTTFFCVRALYLSVMVVTFLFLPHNDFVTVNSTRKFLLHFSWNQWRKLVTCTLMLVKLMQRMVSIVSA